VGTPVEPLVTELCVAIRSSRHNLMGPRALAELETRHVPEALALAEMLPAGPGDVADVGTGGGIPGLVLAIARPDLSFTLIEATGKKAEFLRTTAERLGLDVSVLNARVEASPALHDRFDIATARAVAPLHRLIGWVLPVLRPGGLLLAVKGERWREELAAAGRSLAAARGEVVSVPDDDASTEDGPLVVTIARRR
jgi:16S rRNA (guanine527-N7)-methyltransferase